MTPHMADQTPEGMELLNEGAVDNVSRLPGGPSAERGCNVGPDVSL